MVVDTVLNPDLKVEEENTSESEPDLEHDYNINMSNGKKNLLCNDFPEAVSCFQAACSSQSERFGDTSAECAEPFFYYGRALLELARVENGVLGNALKGVPETEDSDSDTGEQFEKADKLPDHEREQLRQDVAAAMAKEEDKDAQEEDLPDKENVEQIHDDVKDKTIEGESRMLKESKVQPDVKDETSEEGTKLEESKVPESNSDEPSTSTGVVSHEEVGEENIEDPDEISNMQLAWEMLELAKVLYAKKPKSEENSLMTAQCLLKLGELSLEIENYTQAISDFLESLTIHTEFLSAHDRRIAETHYNLGLAYSFTKQHDNAIKHYQAALAVLESRIDFLNELIDENDQKKEKEEDVMQECAEVGELKNLIPDINSKIEDVIMMKRQEARLSHSPIAQKGETSTGFGSTPAISPMATVISVRKESSGSSTSPAPSATASSDISHLLRRKRPPSSEEETANKKIKCEQSVATKSSDSGGELCLKNGSANTEGSTKEKAAGIENQPPEIQS